MQRSLIEIARLSVDLTPRPIEPCWIIEGNPEATSCVLSQSADGLILDGSIVLESDGIPPTRYVAGDVIFFRDGAHAKWHVEGHVRKLAFCRKTSPVWFGLALRVFLKLKKIFLPAGSRQPASLMAG